jgi:hypothetical protein
MPEAKKIMKFFGRDVEVSDVPAISSTEAFNRYELEDGSVLRVKNVATAFLRVEGQFLPDGNPVYIVMTSPAVVVEKATITDPNIV